MTPPEAAGATLVALARSAIGGGFGLPASGRPEEADDAAPWLSAPGATFVTLTLGGRLRGCIGSLVARRALSADVRENAVAAAFGDPRFPPLAYAEYVRIAISVSLLSPAEPLDAGTESDALARLRPGVDGVVLEFANRRSTFLPQVWEDLAAPEVFLAHLKRKAGLPADFWHQDVRISRYTVRSWKDEATRAPGRDNEPRLGERR